MKVAIVQFDNRADSELALYKRLIDKNSAYCRAKRYDHYFLRECGIDLPVYWLKPHIVGNFLERGYDIVLWLDTDAVIHNFDFSIESLFLNDDAVVFAPDNPGWDAKFNAGVFACKGRTGLEIMKAWANLYPADHWQKIGEKWSCSRAWAGSSYEQGAFSEQIIPRYQKHLRCVSWQLLQSPFPLPGSFTVHFAGVFKNNIHCYVEPIAA
jgi:hypothetical protein